MLGLLNNLFWAVLIGCLTFEYAWTALRELIQFGFDRSIDSPNRMEFNALLRSLSPWLAGLLAAGDDHLGGLVHRLGARGRHLDQPRRHRPGRRRDPPRQADRLDPPVPMDRPDAGDGLGRRRDRRGHPSARAGGGGRRDGRLPLVRGDPGAAFSLLSSSTSKSLALSLGWLVFLNVGYLLCCVPLPSPLSSASVSLFGMMPLVVLWGIFSARDVQQFERFPRSRATLIPLLVQRAGRPLGPRRPVLRPRGDGLDPSHVRPIRRRRGSPPVSLSTRTTPRPPRVGESPVGRVQPAIIHSAGCTRPTRRGCNPPSQIGGLHPPYEAPRGWNWRWTSLSRDISTRV